MVWDEIDVENRIWTLPGLRTKNGKPHIVHLSAPSIKLIERTPRLGNYVFSFSGLRPFQDFTNAKRALDESSGVTNWRLHDLRRTCVSGMARLGVPPPRRRQDPQSSERHDFRCPSLAVSVDSAHQQDAAAARARGGCGDHIAIWHIHQSANGAAGRRLGN